MQKKITDALGGYGIFGVELFVTKDAVLFSEVSPRPHDTGLVTLITQDLSEFAHPVRGNIRLPHSCCEKAGIVKFSLVMKLVMLESGNTLAISR